MAKHYGYNQPLLPANYVPRFGVAIAVANLIRCRLLKEEDSKDALVYAPGQLYGFFLDEVTAIRSFPVKGRQGIYEVRIEQELVTLHTQGTNKQ